LKNELGRYDEEKKALLLDHENEKENLKVQYNDGLRALEFTSDSSVESLRKDILNKEERLQQLEYLLNAEKTRYAAESEKLLNDFEKQKTLLEEEYQGNLNTADAARKQGYVSVKEEHAKKAKDDILIIWTDYFKPEHLEKYPDLHSKIWNACKLGSFVKVNVDMEKANEFKAALEEIGDIFWETKK
jgi:nickel-type superoxide dismutase